MNRVLTTAVQILIAGGAGVCVRAMYFDIKEDIKEILEEMREAKK